MAVDMNMNVLIVDDYKTMLRIIGNLLKQLGFKNVFEATDGSMALGMLREKDYGLVISDWNMEPMDGIELLNAIRAEPELKTIPFILATADTAPGRLETARQAGVSSYLTKPYDRMALRACLEEVLGAF